MMVGGALMNGISALIRETSESFLSFLHVSPQRGMASCELGSGSSPDTESVNTLVL